MTKALVQTYTIAHENRIHITRALLAGCLFLAILYAVNLYAVITRTVALQRVESQTAALSTSVDGLDAQYIALSSKVTPDSLAAYGMKTGQVSQYIQRSASLSRVAVGGHEL